MTYIRLTCSHDELNASCNCYPGKHRYQICPFCSSVRRRPLVNSRAFFLSLSGYSFFCSFSFVDNKYYLQKAIRKIVINGVHTNSYPQRIVTPTFVHAIPRWSAKFRRYVLRRHYVPREQSSLFVAFVKSQTMKHDNAGQIFDVGFLPTVSKVVRLQYFSPPSPSIRISTLYNSVFENISTIVKHLPVS